MKFPQELIPHSNRKLRAIWRNDDDAEHVLKFVAMAMGGHVRLADWQEVTGEWSTSEQRLADWWREHFPE